MLTPSANTESAPALYYYRFFHGEPGSKAKSWYVSTIFLPGENPIDAWTRYRTQRGQLMQPHYEQRDRWLQLRAAIAYRLTDDNRLAALNYTPAAKWTHTGPDQWHCVQLSELTVDDFLNLIEL